MRVDDIHDRTGLCSSLIVAMTAGTVESILLIAKPGSVTEALHQRVFDTETVDGTLPPKGVHPAGAPSFDHSRIVFDAWLSSAWFW